MDALLNMEKGRPEILDGKQKQEDKREIEYIKTVNLQCYAMLRLRQPRQIFSGF
jgi:hypothetical protein